MKILIKTIWLMVLVALLPALFVISCSNAGTEAEILFQTEAPDTVPYRIPAFCQLKDGSILAL